MKKELNGETKRFVRFVIPAQAGIHRRGFPTKAFGNDKKVCSARNDGSRTGLTLLELVLALSIILIVFLATGTVSLSAARLTSYVSEEIRLQNEIDYVLHDIEVNIKPGSNPTATPKVVPSPCTSGQCAQVLAVDDSAGNPTITYSYDSTTGTLSKTINGLTEILSTGALIIKPGSSSFFFVPNTSDNLVEINLSARKDLGNGKVISLPGVTKSILLRGSS